MASHHRGARYTRAAKWIKTNATVDPLTVCLECERTMADHPPGVNGQPQEWTAGHTVDGSSTWQLWTRLHDPPPPGDWLAPEASRCNMAKGKRRADMIAHGTSAGL